MNLAKAKSGPGVSIPGPPAFRLATLCPANPDPHLGEASVALFVNHSAVQDSSIPAVPPGDRSSRSLSPQSFHLKGEVERSWLFESLGKKYRRKFRIWSRDQWFYFVVCRFLPWCYHVCRAPDGTVLEN